MHRVPPSFAAGACGVLVLAATSHASANGRFPAASEIAFSPSDADLIVLRATYGILVSHDGGSTWDWLCEDALGLTPSASEDPAIGVTANQSLVAGISGGLEVSPDTGCSWTFAGGALAGRPAVDLVVRPDTPDVVLALTSSYGSDAGTDGGGGYVTGVSRTTDDGAHWLPAGSPLDPGVQVTTLEVAASDPQRVYVSGVRGNGPGRTASLFVSTDQGATWTERPTPFDPSTESQIFIGAVDPMSAETVYVRSSSTTGSRLFVTTDAGQTFSIAALPLTGSMLGFALAPDGSKAYAGSVEDGLFVAPRGSLSFQNTSGLPVRCLATRGAEVWACSDDATGFVAGVSTDDGASFTARLRLADIRGALACPAGTSASQCTAENTTYNPPYDPFVALCSTLGGCVDAGATPLADACEEAGACGSKAVGPDAGPGPSTDAGDTPAAAPHSSCGCVLVRGGGALGALGFLAWVLGVAFARRRRRASPGP